MPRRPRRRTPLTIVRYSTQATPSLGGNQKPIRVVDVTHDLPPKPRRQMSGRILLSPLDYISLWVRLGAWVLHMAGNWLDRQGLVRLLRALEAFAIVTAVVLFWFEVIDRTAERHNRAWSLIAQAKTAGGHIGLADALQLLHEDDSRLDNVPLDGAWIERVRLPGAKMVKAQLSKATLDRAVLSEADLQSANLTKASLFRANLSKANLWHSSLTGAYLLHANLSNAFLEFANMEKANLTFAKLKGTSKNSPFSGVVDLESG